MRTRAKTLTASLALAGGLALGACTTTTTARPAQPAPSTSQQTAEQSAPPTPTPKPSSSEPINTVGGAMIATQDGQDAATIKITSVTTSTKPADAYSDGPQNGVFVKAHVTATTFDSYTEGFDISSSDFYTVQSGHHYDEGNGNALFSSDTSLEYVTLGAAETTTGTLTFDVPSAHGKIAYSPNFEGGPLGYWRY